LKELAQRVKDSLPILTKAISPKTTTTKSVDLKKEIIPGSIQPSMEPVSLHIG